MKKHSIFTILPFSILHLRGYGFSLWGRLVFAWEFTRQYYGIQQATKLWVQKIMSLLFYLKKTVDVSGAMAELGVYKGGTAKLMADVVPDKPLYLFDTFGGMPQVKAIDIHKAGDFADTSVEEVSGLLGTRTNAIFRKGFFPETAKGLEDERFSFVHIDGDLYQSTLDSLVFFYPRMPKGGVMILDDYEWPDCPGVKQAMDEFLADKPERPFVQTKYQAILIKQ